MYAGFESSVIPDEADMWNALNEAQHFKNPFTESLEAHCILGEHSYGMIIVS